MKITANLATHEARKEILPKAVDSLKNQTLPFDEIRIYANDYTPQIEGVTVATGEDLTDNGKFCFIGEDEIYFSCDDDILYPPFYVEYMLSRLRDYPECIISMHGRQLKGKGLNYYYGHNQIHCLRELPEDKVIDVPGTGVSCFDTRYFKPEIAHSDDQKMSDVLVGVEAAKKGVDVIAVAHSIWWLKGLGVQDSIYHEQRTDCDRQTELCGLIWDEKY